MYKIAVCDDESSQRQIIIDMIGRTLGSSNRQYKIFEFNRGEKLILQTENYDIYFLDIQMDKITGVELARRIRLANESAIIIFVTGHKDYLFDAFDVMAFNYILKPIDEKRFRDIIYSAMYQFEKKNKFIIAKTIRQSAKIYLKDIMYIEAEQRKLKVHTTYEVIEYYHKISDIEQELDECNFFRCHKSYIVNLKYIQSYDNTFIFLKNLEKIYISKYKLTDFSKAFMYYLKNER